MASLLSGSILQCGHCPFAACRVLSPSQEALFSGHCPVIATGQRFRRETSTMPQWAGSCWYYIRYLQPWNAAAPVDRAAEQYWLPVDLYMGAPFFMGCMPIEGLQASCARRAA